MEFKRKQDISRFIEPKRVLVIYGPRRVGKTTLLTEYLSTQSDKKIFFSTGDDVRLRTLFQSEDRDKILDFARPYDIVAIDEAQSIPSIGLGAKMLIDAYPEKNIILTGSSSFDLSNKVGEPLTGRHFTLTLLPLSLPELQGSRFDIEGELEKLLIYGSYPEVLHEPDPAKKEKILHELVSSYLFKDVLALERIKSPDMLLDIAKCIAFQVGAEVSLNEIAKLVKADVKTVGRYLDLLEKMFVIKRVRGFSRNLRNEIAKKAKYYFLDNGVRNAVIGSFNSLDLRSDVGGLWEDFVCTELLKQDAIADATTGLYFWRTHGGQEIDIVRESGGSLEAIECKWRDARVSAPKQWREAYPEARFITITKDTYLDYFLR